MPSSLETTEATSAAVATAPRVKLVDLEESILERIDRTGIEILGEGISFEPATYKALAKFSLCVLVLKNGFVVVGKSAPASDVNYNRDVGRMFAYEDAMRQLWPLMGFALREKLSAT